MTDAPDLLDVVVLAEPPSPAALARCLFALAMQDYAPVRVHVAARRRVTTAEELPVTPHVLPGASPGALLNAAVRRGQGRYLAVLDSAAVVQPFAFPRLVARLAETGAALAAGGVARKEALVTRHATVVLRRVEEPGPALAALVLDRTRIRPRDLRVPPGAREPGPLLLRRLLDHYPCEEALRGTVMVDRYLPVRS